MLNLPTTNTNRRAARVRQMPNMLRRKVAVGEGHQGDEGCDAALHDRLLPLPRDETTNAINVRHVHAAL